MASELAISLAQERFDRMKNRATRYWQEQARDAKEAHDREEWKTLGYDSFNDYLDAACDWGRSQTYAGMRALEKLSDLPAEVVERLPLGNAVILSNIPPQERDAETVRDAVEGTQKNFVQSVKRRKPNLHINVSETVSFKLHEGAQEVWRNALEDAKEEIGGKNVADGEAVEYIITQWQAGRGGETTARTQAIQAWVRTVEAIINELLPTLKFPDAKQWARNVIACERVRQAFGFAKGDAAEVKPKRTPKAPPATAERAAVTNRIQ